MECREGSLAHMFMMCLCLERAQHIIRETLILVLDTVGVARIEKLDIAPSLTCTNDERRPPLFKILKALVIRPDRAHNEHAATGGVGSGEWREVGAGGRGGGFGRPWLLDLWRVASSPLALLLDDSARLRDQFDVRVKMVGT